LQGRNKKPSRHSNIFKLGKIGRYFIVSESDFFQPNIRDKLTSLEARLSVQLPASRADLSPVLGLATAAAEFQSLSGLPQDISLVTRDSVSIQKDCGEDNLCVPDLRLTYSRYRPEPRRESKMDTLCSVQKRSYL
jgi:hypothetical protein